MKISLPLALTLVDNVHKNGAGWKAICPAHVDLNPSLSLALGDTQELILRCHAGCEYDAVLDQMRKRLQQQNCDYIYRDVENTAIGKVTRRYDSNGNKQFYQSFLRDGKWVLGGSDDLKNTPYNLPAVLNAIDSGRKVFIVEGEKDVDRLAEKGHVATCNAGGSGKWKDTHSKFLVRAKRIFIIADNDESGHKHAWSVYDSLQNVGVDCPITVLYSPFAKDVTDHSILGHDLKELERLERETKKEGWVSLASFIFDSPAEVPAIWGTNGKVVLWAEGQGCMLVAPQGIGKTTLTSLILEARLGLSTEVLGYAVQPSKKGVYYLAMDRPSQIAGSMRRIFEKHGREAVEACPAYAWPKAPERDLAKHPTDLRDMVLDTGADTVFIDSLKDAAMAISKEESGQGWNRAVQLCLEAGIEVMILNHPVKRAGQDEKPVTLDDVYGNQWITAGLGSVMSLWGTTDSVFAELRHLKQPSEPLETLTLRRHGKTGLFEVIGNGRDWEWFFTEPHTVSDLASEMFPGETNKSNENKARRIVEDLLHKGLIVKHSETLPSRGKTAARYMLKEPE